MALAKNKQRPSKAHERRLVVAPAKAATIHYTGGYSCADANGLVVAGSDAAGLRPLGVNVEPHFGSDPDKQVAAHLDNSAGSNGVVVGDDVQRAVKIDTTGEYAFTVSAGTPVAGAPAYLVDDDTVSAAATTHSIVAGEFTRAFAAGVWFVDVGRRGVAVALSV